MKECAGGPDRPWTRAGRHPAPRGRAGRFPMPRDRCPARCRPTATRSTRRPPSTTWPGRRACPSRRCRGCSTAAATRCPETRDTGDAGRRRARFHPGRGGAGAERPAQGNRRRGHPPSHGRPCPADDFYADEDESLQFPDLINRGIEVAAQHRDFNLLVRSVDVDDHDYSRRIFALARKSDGLILHDRVLEPDQLERLSRQVPIVTLAGMPTPTTANVGSDNVAGMRELGPPPGPRPRLPHAGLPRRPREQPGQHRPARRAQRGGHRRRARPSSTARSGRATTSRRAAPG